MFHSARIKLTAWYLLIIMLISVSFSVGVYKILSSELDRVERAQRLRIEGRFPERFRIIPPPEIPDESLRSLFLDPELIAETKDRLQLTLIIINLAILASSAVAGYFLAGKTLRPIEKAMEEQKRFVADASHEMRTPLTALKTSMEVALRDKKMSLSEAKEVLKSNLEEIDNLGLLSSNLLNLANWQNNGQSLVFKNIQISEAVKNAYRKILPLANKKDIAVKLQAQDLTIQANKESLEQMILIFLDNAVKYTPNGGKVTLTTKSEDKSIALKIEDTGIGIAKEETAHIFERFYRADQSRSREHLRGGGVGGFGLGLSLAKRIIEIHKGTVEVASVLGKGTTFTIKLPLKHA